MKHTGENKGNLQSLRTSTGELRVIKIGGGVLRTPEDIEDACGKIASTAEDGVLPVVVVSALYGVTNRLIELMGSGSYSTIPLFLEEVFSISKGEGNNASDIISKLSGVISQAGENCSLLRDEILSYGEKITSIVVADRLVGLGRTATMVDAGNIIKLKENGCVDIDESRARSGAIRELVRSGHIVVIPGFYGTYDDGRTAILGRGGSDYSAGIVASCLDATELEFWKDVDGIMSADPRYVEKPVTFSNVSSTMAMEISMLGGKILHPQALRLIDFSKCTVRIKNVRKPSDFGTIVGVRNKKAASVVVKTDLVLATWTADTGFGGNLSEVLTSILTEGPNPYSITATGSAILSIFDREDFSRFENVLRGLAARLSAKMKLENPLTMISVISDLPSFHMRRLRADILTALYDIEIFEKAVISLNPNLSFAIVVDRYDSASAISAIHETVTGAETRTWED